MNGWNTKITAIQSATSQWNLDGSGSWSNGANWTAAVPGSADDKAIFGSVATAPRIVTVDAPTTVGLISFDNVNSYTIGGSSAVTLNTSTGQPGITVNSGSHTISAPVVLGKDTTITTGASSGVDVTGALTATGRTITKAGAGTAQFANIRATGLTVNAGTVKISPKPTANDSAGTSVLNSISLAYYEGVPLDLTNNSMIVDYTTLGTLMSNMATWLRRGQLISSSADTAHRLGFGNNTILGKTTFGGQTVDATSVLVKYTYGGDANLDGQVDISDLGALATGWQTINTWTSGDFDYNGLVDISDLGILATNWQLGVGSPLGPSFDEALASVGLAGVSVPEPAALAAIVLAVGASRRRRPIIRRPARTGGQQ